MFDHNAPLLTAYELAVGRAMDDQEVVNDATFGLRTAA